MLPSRLTEHHQPDHDHRAGGDIRQHQWVSRYQCFLPATFAAVTEDPAH